MNNNQKEEVLYKDLKTKEVYHYIDNEMGINQISREVYKNTDKEIHYPRGYEGGEKYTTIRKFTFLGFKTKLPVGIIKSVNYGWGFTKTLNPLAFYLNDNYDFEDVVIEKNGKVDFDLDNKTLFLNEKSLKLLNEGLSRTYKKNKSDIDFSLKLILSQLFSEHIEKPVKNYTENALASSLASWGNSIDEFSEDDKKAIIDLFDKLSLTDFLSKESLSKTKEIVDSKFIQKTLKDFDTLISRKSETNTLEKDWQSFLQNNSWIFSSIFAQPVILHQKEAYVGGKTLDNKNGKVSDFLLKNSLSDNVTFLEIKTHKTKLVENNSYRGKDVYSISKELSGSMIQALNQRDNFQKEYYSLKYKSKEHSNFETFNSKCIVLIGMLSELYQTHKI